MGNNSLKINIQGPPLDAYRKLQALEELSKHISADNLVLLAEKAKVTPGIDQKIQMLKNYL